MERGRPVEWRKAAMCTGVFLVATLLPGCAAAPPASPAPPEAPEEAAPPRPVAEILVTRGVWIPNAVSIGPITDRVAEGVAKRCAERSDIVLRHRVAADGTSDCHCTGAIVATVQWQSTRKPENAREDVRRGDLVVDGGIPDDVTWEDGRVHILVIWCVRGGACPGTQVPAH